MRAVDAELVVGAGELESGALRAWLAYDGGELVGYYAFRGEPPVLVLDSMFVAPARMRRGIGGLLWNHALATARAHGATAFTFDADPNAAGFYRSRGARETGAHPSRSFPNRMLPAFEVRLAADDASADRRNPTPRDGH